MKYILPFVFTLLCIVTVNAQDDERQLLRGQVLYRNVNVPYENVINSTSETATITNKKGEFSILVKIGDELVFTAVNYRIEVITITAEILKRNRLVVEVNEKVTELDEVVISPENQKRFLEMKNEELKGFDYEIDRSTEVENIAMSLSERGMRDGINFVNIFKALAKSNKKPKEVKKPLKLSEVLRQVYDDEFFVVDLMLPQQKIDEFLFFCDSKMPTQSLLKKANEFQLIDFLVTQSKTFRQQLNVQN